MDLSEIYGDDDAPEYGPAWPDFDERVQVFTEDPRWKPLNGADRRHMKALLASCDPLTGHLEMPARGLAELLDVTEETLRLSRLRLIKAGLIVSYQPGTGHTASTYRIAQSWEEADRAAASEPECDVASSTPQHLPSATVAPMMSIRTHRGPIDLCGSCGQPCYLDDNPENEYGPFWRHFAEQWDGVGCQWFPFAGKPLGAKLDRFSVDGIRALYPNTNPDRI